MFGLLIGWFFWGRLKNKVQTVEIDWQRRYSDLNNDFQSITKDFSGLETELNNKASRISALNNTNKELLGKLSSCETVTQKANKEIEQLKNQLGQTTARFHITSKELEERNKELNTLRNTPDEIGQLKSLLGEATRRYNQNGLDLKNKQETLENLENRYEVTKKHSDSLSKELHILRTKLIERDNEFENQAEVLSDLQKKLNEKDVALSAVRKDLDLRNEEIIDQKEILLRDERIAALQQKLFDLDNLRKNYDSKSEEVAELKQTLDQTRQQIPLLESSLKKRDASITALETEITKLSKEIPPLRDNLDKRDDQISLLKQEVNTLKHKIPALKNTISARDAHIRELEIFIKEAQNAILKPANRVASFNGNGKSNGNSHQNGNGHSNGLTDNVVHINGNGKFNGSGKTNGTEKPKLIASSNGLNGKSKNSNTSKRKIKAYGLKKPTRKPDDLKQISGIGITLEKTLHKCGIYYFEQIAGFTRKDVTTVDGMLNFKGRIDRDEWIKQAKVLLRGGTYTRKKPTRKNTPSKRRIKPLGMKRPAGELDDLQLINGVGPKLERKLHRLGIYHFEQIAEFTAEDIALVDSKLKTYKGRVKRDKWPTQARRLHKEFHLR